MGDRRPDGQTRLREWSRAAKNRGEWSRHAQLFVKLMSQTSQTRTESDYTRAFSDASANVPDQSVVMLHVPTVNATSLPVAYPGIFFGGGFNKFS